MTSRLKRKLGDLGVDTSSRKANESFCLIGTPLPPLEKSKDTGEFVPLWKQEVVDEKGRRRLHGAFTGGFSAGYFNTVGSKEGWAPSTFVSSRSDRAKKKAAKPEDFMDEEDLQELKDSRNIVDTTDEMEFSGTSAELASRERGADIEQDSVASALAASLLPAPNDSVGARILKKMGWRLGQGIGPRVSLRQRRLQDLEAQRAASGSRITGDAIKVTDDDEEANKHTYAPRDTPVLVVDRKDDSHGLGYHPGMGLQESLGDKGSGRSSGPTLAAGFGLGALNDADEDDLDVYDGGSTSIRNRLAYDVADHAEDDTIAIGTHSRKGKKAEVNSASSASTFRDGMPVLASFVLSDKPVAEDRWFPMPEIPKGWTPDPRRVWDKDPNKENISKIQSSEPIPHNKWKSSVSIETRGSMLGETPTATGTRSVFEYMSEKDKQRLKNIAATAKGEGAAPVPAPATAKIARTEPNIAQAALKGFQPFTTDLMKQARYTAYLQSQLDSTLPAPTQTPTQSVDEFNKEMEDYAKAALIFKPMSGAMAGRFTSAAVVDHGPKIHEGLHTPSKEEMAQKEEEKRKEEEENVSPKVHAARMGLYGPMTREIEPWQPAKLLCKRFGVKDPNPPPEAPAETPSSAKASTADMPPPEAYLSQPNDTTPNQTIDGPRDLANIGLGEDETQGKDTLTYQKPSMDVFKAIFASDSEDSDDDEKDEIEEDIEPGPIAAPALNVTQETVAVTVAPTVVDNTPLDITTFKPTFVPRESRSTKDKDKKDKRKEKTDKKDKRKKEKKGILVSFELDEDNIGEDSSKPSKERPKKKRRDAKEKREDDDDGTMWVEKPPPEILKNLPVPTSVLNISEDATASQKGRKRAIDFM